MKRKRKQRKKEIKPRKIKSLRGKFMRLLKELPKGLVIYSDYTTNDISAYSRMNLKIKTEVYWTFSYFGKVPVLKKITRIQKK